jgi:hypothetical protein
MSTPPGQDPNADHDDDGINIKKIIVVGALSLAIFAISAIIAHVIMRSDVAKLEAAGKPPIPTSIGRDEIGIVDQVEFDSDRRLAEWRAAKQKRLTTYGWSDRTKQIIHIPIDKAMDEVVAQAAGGTQQ